MAGYVTIDGETTPLAIHPGMRLPDGRSIALTGPTLTIGDARHAADYLHDGETLWVRLNGHTHEVRWHDAVDYLGATGPGAVAGGEARASMPGVVVAVAVAVGDTVAIGDPLIVIESMKLETTVAAAIPGTVMAVHVGVGDSFERDAVLAVVAGD